MALTKDQKELYVAVRGIYENYDIEKQVEIETVLGVVPEIEVENYDPENPSFTKVFVMKKIHEMYKNDEDMTELERIVINKLPQEMLEAISEIYTTPIDEKDLDIEKIEDLQYVFDFAEKRTSIKQADYSREQYIKFSATVIMKITSHEDENGCIKETDTLKKIGAISSQEVTKIMKLVKSDNFDLETIYEMFQESRKLPKNISDWELAHLFKFVEKQIIGDMNTFFGVFKKTH